MEYFDQLSADIGDDWARLAGKLMLGRPAIQRITLSNAHYNSSAERCRRSARETLLQWFRSSARSHNRVRNSSELRQIQFQLLTLEFRIVFIRDVPDVIFYYPAGTG